MSTTGKVVTSWLTGGLSNTPLGSAVGKGINNFGKWLNRGKHTSDNHPDLSEDNPFYGRSVSDGTSVLWDDPDVLASLERLRNTPFWDMAINSGLSTYATSKNGVLDGTFLKPNSNSEVARAKQKQAYLQYLDSLAESAKQYQLNSPSNQVALERAAGINSDVAGTVSAQPAPDVHDPETPYNSGDALESGNDQAMSALGAGMTALSSLGSLGDSLIQSIFAVKSGVANLRSMELGNLSTLASLADFEVSGDQMFYDPLRGENVLDAPITQASAQRVKFSKRLEKKYGPTYRALVNAKRQSDAHYADLLEKHFRKNKVWSDNQATLSLPESDNNPWEDVLGSGVNQTLRDFNRARIDFARAQMDYDLKSLEYDQAYRDTYSALQKASDDKQKAALEKKLLSIQSDVEELHKGYLRTIEGIPSRLLDALENGDMDEASKLEGYNSVLKWIQGDWKAAIMSGMNSHYDEEKEGLKKFDDGILSAEDKLIQRIMKSKSRNGYGGRTSNSAQSYVFGSGGGAR